MGFQLQGRVAVLGMVAALPALGRCAPQSAAGEIRDPSTGAVWVLVRNAEHPGGPGRLVLVESGNETASGTAARVFLIHAGDRIVVEEHSPVVDASLEAVAETGAAQGERLRARMTIGGRVVTVRATAAARAELPPEADR
jgi:hypothetical protein